MMICGAKFHRYLHADVYSTEWAGSVPEADDGHAENGLRQIRWAMPTLQLNSRIGSGVIYKNLTGPHARL
jgi:hypothetical protein